MAYAIMDAPNSETVRRLSEEVDSTTGKKAFKFLRVALPRGFYRAAVDQTGSAIYEEGKIPTTGWFTSNITTVTVPAALVASKDFAYGNSRALDVFTEAAKRAESAIKAAVAPKD